MKESKPKSSTIVMATKWSLFTQVISKIIPPLSSMILARFFAPEVFGIIATITMVTSFADTFSESGFQKYIISHKYDNDSELSKDSDVAYWTNLGISILLWCVISIFSTYLCNVLGNPGIEKALIIACLQLPITSMTSIQSAIYQKYYDFRKICIVQFVAAILTLIVTLILAYLDFNYWSIIIGTLFGCIIRAALLTFGSKWHPHLYYSFRRIKNILSFSLWVLSEGMAVWITSWFDSFMVGNRLSSHNLGIYKNSQSIVNSALSIPQNSIYNVLFVTLSKLRDDTNSYNSFFLYCERMLGYILLPLATGLFIFRKLAVRVAFGVGWEDAELVVGVWAFASVMRVLFVSINTAVYVSKGKPKLSLICQLIDMAFLIPTCIIGIKLGFEKFVLLRGIVRMDIIIPNFIILSKVFGIKFLDIAKNMSKPFIATAGMSIFAIGVQSISSSCIWWFIAMILCVNIYVIILWIIAREDVKSLIHFVKKS